MYEELTNLNLTNR